MDDQFLNREVVIKILKTTLYSRDALQLVLEMPTVERVKACESHNDTCPACRSNCRVSHTDVKRAETRGNRKAESTDAKGNGNAESTDTGDLPENSEKEYVSEVACVPFHRIFFSE